MRCKSDVEMEVVVVSAEALPVLNEVNQSTAG